MADKKQHREKQKQPALKSGEDALRALAKELERPSELYDRICPVELAGEVPVATEPLVPMPSPRPSAINPAAEGVGQAEKQFLNAIWQETEARSAAREVVKTPPVEALRIGTRGSALALWQARWVQSLLEAAHPGLKVELVTIKTTGDKILDVPLAQVGGKGLFVKELEEAMLEGRVDLAVHSMKDVPTEFPAGLVLGPILQREDSRDALLSVRFNGLADLPHQARVGSSSLRRQSQIRHLRPDLEIVSLRGNVNTRIQKLENGEFDAIILAAAGVKRLQMTGRVVEYLDPTIVIPAIGQGAVGIELRLDDARTAHLLASLNHRQTQLCVLAERALLARLEGGCQVPIAAHAVLEGESLILSGRVADLEGKVMITAHAEGLAVDAEAIGARLAETLLHQGADKILQEVYQR